MIGDAVDRATDRVGDRVTSILLSYAAKVGLAVAAFLLFVGVVVCGCIGAYWALEPTYGPNTSLAFVAGGLAVGATFCALGAMMAGRTLTLAGTVKPVEVVEEESHEAVDTVGPYKFVAAALGAGALLGGMIGGRSAGDQSLKPSTASSLLDLIPTAISAMTLVNSHFAAGSPSRGAQDPGHTAHEARRNPMPHPGKAMPG